VAGAGLMAGAGLAAGAGPVAGADSVVGGALGCDDDGAGIGKPDLDLVCWYCQLWGPA
jgi:hypothetical protein